MVLVTFSLTWDLVSWLQLCPGLYGRRLFFVVFTDGQGSCPDPRGWSDLSLARLLVAVVDLEDFAATTVESCHHLGIEVATALAFHEAQDI
ncbi:hypothetical protein ACVW0Q_001984 [Thermostichus sp. MS-CIW-21]